MKKWNLGSSSDDEVDKTTQEGRHPMNKYASTTSDDIESEHGFKPSSNDMNSTKEDNEVEWNIMTPNVAPPHVEWAINSREMEILIPKKDFFELAKRIFADCTLWTTKSWIQEKFTISKVTHPEIQQHWQQRYKLFLPRKAEYGGKTCSVYPPFIRLLIAEFLLKWKVDYSWENIHGDKVSLNVHKSVVAIAANRKETSGKNIQTPFVNKGKRKMDDMQKMDTCQNEGTLGISNKEKITMQSVCKSLGADIGDFIEKSLSTKYNVTLCDSSTVHKFKSKLEAAESKIKELEKLHLTSTTSHEVNEYKVRLFDKNEEIKKLTEQLADGLSDQQQQQLVEKENAIVALQNQLASQRIIMADLQNQLASQEMIMADLQQQLNTHIL